MTLDQFALAVLAGIGLFCALLLALIEGHLRRIARSLERIAAVELTRRAKEVGRR